MRPEALDQAQIEELVAEHLSANLAVVTQAALAQALHDFVDKACAPGPLHALLLQAFWASLLTGLLAFSSRTALG